MRLTQNRRRLVGLVLTAALLVLGPAAASAATTIKLGTLAPNKSSWMKIFKRAAREVNEKTGGEVKIKIYGGGSQGDERVMVEKMRTGQIQAAALTAVGLAELAPEVLVLQAAGLITTNKVLDRVRSKLRGRFEKTIEAQGFVLLGWGDVGIAYFYSAERIAEPADLKGVRVWIWNSDPVARELSAAAGISGVPLGVPDVLPSLNTGHVNTFFASPLACLSLQWFTKVKYRVADPIGMAVGALVVSKKSLEGLSPEHQKIVRDVVGKWTRALVKKVRADNKKAAAILAKKGIEDVVPTEAQKKAWRKLAHRIQERLVGKVYPRDLLEQARRLAGWKAP